MLRKYLRSAKLGLLAFTMLFISACNASGDTGTSEDSTAIDEGSAATAQGAVAPPNRLDLIVGNGYLFRVWKNESDSHRGAAIALVKTAKSRNPADVRYGLFFMQRNTQTGDSGEAMLCPEATTVIKSDGTPDLALSCSQEVGATEETLTVGTLDSEFCTNLRNDPKIGQHIATDDQCTAEFPGKDRQCVCYDIEHKPIQSPKSGWKPPTNGSGSGGRGGG